MPSPFNPKRRPGRGPGRTLQWVDSTPIVTSVSPPSDRNIGGVAITISGDQFRYETDGTAPSVKIGGVAATVVVVVDRHTITCVAPANPAGLYDIVVTNGNGQAGTLANVFAYVATIVDSVAPNHGPLAGGTRVTITGKNFLSTATILIGGLPVTSPQFIDASHFSCITPAHVVGPVPVSVDGVTIQGGFFYTLLTRGDDIRRSQPSGIQITERLGNAQNSCTFVVDGSSAPPSTQETIEITDSLDGSRLFAGIVQTVDQIYEGQRSQLAWQIGAVDFTSVLAKRRPFGVYTDTSVSDIVKDLITRYVGGYGFTTNHVQTNLCKVNVSFDGSMDLTQCLSFLQAKLGDAHWYVDYDKDVHFFHIASKVATPIVPDTVINPTGPLGSAACSLRMASSGGSAGNGTSFGYSYPPGYYALFSTFVHSDGTSGTTISGPNGSISPAVDLNVVPVFGHNFDVGHDYEYCFTISLQGASPAQETEPSSVSNSVTGQYSHVSGQLGRAAAFKLQFPKVDGLADLYKALGQNLRLSVYRRKDGGSWRRITNALSVQTGIQGSYWYDQTGDDGGTAVDPPSSGTMHTPDQPGHETESAFSQVSNLVFMDGRHLFDIQSLPIGTSFAGLTVTKRKLYYNFYGFDLAHGERVPFGSVGDNTTTNLICGINGQNGVVTVATPFSGTPAVAVVAPPTGPKTAPSAREAGSGSTSAVPSTQLVDITSSHDLLPDKSIIYSPGWYSFAITNIYRDGTESQRSPGSKPILLTGTRAVILAYPASETPVGVGVAYRIIYASVYTPAPNLGVPQFKAGTCRQWDMITGGDSAEVYIAPAFGQAVAPPGVGSNTVVDPCIDGPFLEGTDPPADIDDDNTDLLRTPQVVLQIDTSQVRNRVYVRGAGTTTTADANVGAQSLNIADASTMPPHGGYAITTTGLVIHVTGMSSTSGAATINFDTPLTDVLPTGTGIRPTVQVDDKDSQKELGKIEVDANGQPTDGVHEGFIDDPSLITFDQCVARGYAELEVFAHPTKLVRYSTRDRKSHPGQQVKFNLSDPPISGTFLIQEVVIDQVHDESDDLGPRFNVMANASPKFDLNDLLLKISDLVSGDDLSAAGLVQTAVANAVNSIVFPAAGVGTLAISIIDVTDTQLLAMSNVNEIALVAAPGAGAVWVPVYFFVEKTSNNAFSSLGTAGALNFFWGGAGVGSFNGFNFCSVNVDLTSGNRSANVSAVNSLATVPIYSTRDPRNRTISVIGGSAYSLGSGPLGSLSIRITILYYKASSIAP